jgi:hypothetical protein
LQKIEKKSQTDFFSIFSGTFLGASAREVRKHHQTKFEKYLTLSRFWPLTHLPTTGVIRFVLRPLAPAHSATPPPPSAKTQGQGVRRRKEGGQQEQRAGKKRIGDHRGGWMGQMLNFKGLRSIYFIIFLLCFQTPLAKKRQQSEKNKPRKFGFFSGKSFSTRFFMGGRGLGGGGDLHVLLPVDPNSIFLCNAAQCI